MSDYVKSLGFRLASDPALTVTSPANSWPIGFFATFQPSPNFGRILAAYGGVFVAGSLAWVIIFDGFRPDR